MKTLKITLLMLVVISTTAMAQKTSKVGHINSNELLTAMPERNLVQEEIKEYA